ncbi:hypothetical protein F4604DRAFT_1937168 [Suillus subluteus]|nr:hypothetical protein F4604DRAFT_1937168 [Suillus subluteus]
MTSVIMVPQSQADFYANLDPSLQPISQEAQGEASYRSASLSIGQEAQAEVITSEDDTPPTDDADESGTDEESDNDNGEIGWGGDYGCHSMHPSFSKEGIPVSQPQTIALPSVFEFQHSRDKGGNVTMRLLAVNETSSSNDAMNEADDVLQHHYKKNGHPHLPDPAILDLIHQHETKATNAKSGNSGVKAKKVKTAKFKESTEGPKPTQLGWYPPWWKTFLEEAKGECCAQHVIENVFPDSIKDLPLSVTEALTTSLIEWLEAGNEVEAGIWSDHKADMAKLKTAISTAPSMYNLTPPPEILPQACTAWIENTATQLLHESLFLHNGLDDLGRTNNAAHPALCAAAITFFYTGSYHIAHSLQETRHLQREVTLALFGFDIALFECGGLAPGYLS